MILRFHVGRHSRSHPRGESKVAENLIRVTHHLKWVVSATPHAEVRGFKQAQRGVKPDRQIIWQAWRGDDRRTVKSAAGIILYGYYLQIAFFSVFQQAFPVYNVGRFPNR